MTGMSARQQVKFLMQKTKDEANWDMDNDSDLKGGSGKFLFLIELTNFYFSRIF